jgi:hypothetical protein
MAAEFFRRLLDRESNIDSDRLDWYAANLDTAVMDYWAVDHPGRLRRSWETGAPVPQRATVAQFLARTGVLELFLRRETVGLAAVQSAVVNPWGFVGYQFGEAMLIDLGYYEPARETVRIEGESYELPAYYSAGLPDATWRGGRTRHVHHDDDAGAVRIGTDVNEWRGRFTGRDGVWSFGDLRRQDGQAAILRASLRHNAEILGGWFDEHGRDVWNPGPGCPAPAALLAAAHLCGPYAVLEHLAHARPRSDEAGTPLTAYLDEFADVPLGPADLREPSEV